MKKTNKTEKRILATWVGSSAVRSLAGVDLKLGDKKVGPPMACRGWTLNWTKKMSDLIASRVWTCNWDQKGWALIASQGVELQLRKEKVELQLRVNGGIATGTKD